MHECRLHDKDQRRSVGIIDSILTEDLNTNKWGYSYSYIEAYRAQLYSLQLKESLEKLK